MFSNIFSTISKLVTSQNEEPLNEESNIFNFNDEIISNVDDLIENDYGNELNIIEYKPSKIKNTTKSIKSHVQKSKKRKRNFMDIIKKTNAKKLNISNIESEFIFIDNKYLGSIYIKSFTSDKLYTINIFENMKDTHSDKYYCECNCGMQYIQKPRRKCKHIAFLISSIMYTMTDKIEPISKNIKYCESVNNIIGDLQKLNIVIENTKPGYQPDLTNNILHNALPNSSKTIDEESDLFKPEDKICEFNYTDEFNKDISIKLVKISDKHVKNVIQCKCSCFSKRCEHIKLITCSLFNSYTSGSTAKTKKSNQFERDINNLVSFNFQ